jgi:hypothetical protein
MADDINKRDDTEKALLRKFGDHTVVIDPLFFYPHHVNELRNHIAHLRANRGSAYYRNPKENNETRDDYINRVEQLQITESIIPRDGETREEFATRVHGPNQADLDFALPIINKMIEIQAKEKNEPYQELTRDNYNCAAWPNTRSFIYDCLKRIGVYAIEFDNKS